MAYTPTRLYIGKPGTSEGTLYTAVGTGTIIKQLVATNIGSSSSALSVSLVPTGGSAGPTNRLISQVAVAVGSVVVIDLSQVMTAGDFLSAVQTVSGAVTLTISGVNI